MSGVNESPQAKTIVVSLRSERTLPDLQIPGQLLRNRESIPLIFVDLTQSGTRQELQAKQPKA